MATDIDLSSLALPAYDPGPLAPSSPFSEGLSSGVEGLKSSAYGAVAAAGRGFGAKRMEKAALEAAAEHSARAGESARRVEDVTDVGSGFDYAKWAIGSILPSSLAFMGAAGAGRGFGAVAARNATLEATKAFAKNVGAGVGGMAASTMLEAGQIFPDAVESGVDNPLLRTAIGAPAAGALDFAGNAIPAARLGLFGAKAAATGVVRRGITGAVTTAAKDVALNAPVEGLTETGQSFIERLAAGKPVTGHEAVSDYINSFFPGLLGGTLTAPASAVRGYMGNQQDTTKGSSDVSGVSHGAIDENVQQVQDQSASGLPQSVVPGVQERILAGEPSASLASVAGTAPESQLPGVLQRPEASGKVGSAAVPVRADGSANASSGLQQPASGGVDLQGLSSRTSRIGTLGEAVAAKSGIAERLAALQKESALPGKQRDKGRTKQEIARESKQLGKLSADIDAASALLPSGDPSTPAVEQYAPYLNAVAERDGLNKRLAQINTKLDAANQLKPEFNAETPEQVKDLHKEAQAAQERVHTLDRVLSLVKSPTTGDAPVISDLPGHVPLDGSTPALAPVETPRGGSFVEQGKLDTAIGESRKALDTRRAQIESAYAQRDQQRADQRATEEAATVAAARGENADMAVKLGDVAGTGVQDTPVAGAMQNALEKAGLAKPAVAPAAPASEEGPIERTFREQRAHEFDVVKAIKKGNYQKMPDADLLTAARRGPVSVQRKALEELGKRYEIEKAFAQKEAVSPSDVVDDNDKGAPANATPDEATEKIRNDPFIKWLVARGGISAEYAKGLTGEGAFKSNHIVNGMFKTAVKGSAGVTTAGHGLDEIATAAAAEGWISAAELESADGGVEAITERISAALRGERQPNMADEDAAYAAMREKAHAGLSPEDLQKTGYEALGADLQEQVDYLLSRFQDLAGDEQAENIIERIALKTEGQHEDFFRVELKNELEARFESLGVETGFSGSSGETSQAVAESAQSSSGNNSASAGQVVAQADPNQETGAIGPARDKTTKASLEKFFDDESNLGVVYDDAEGVSLYPDGSYAVVCTDGACQVLSHMGRGEIWGYAGDNNQHAKLGMHDVGEGGHDFAVVDGRYLVDVWLKHVDQTVDRSVFDLEDKADAKEVADLYGDKSKWVRLQSREQAALSQSPLSTYTAADLEAKARRDNDASISDRERIKRESEAAAGSFSLQPENKPQALADLEASLKINDMFAVPEMAANAQVAVDTVGAPAVVQAIADSQQVPQSAQKSKSTKFEAKTDGGINQAERELRDLSHDVEVPGDVLLNARDKLRYVSFENAVKYAKEAIASGVRPVPAQLHFTLDLAMRDIDRVLSAAVSETTKPDVLFSRDAAVRPYDERGARYSAIGSEIQSYFDRILGGSNDLQVGMFESAPGAPVGRFSPGATKDVIQIAYNARVPLSVAAHEGWHRIEARHLNAQERAIVRRDLKKGSYMYNEVVRLARESDAANNTELADEIAGNPREASAYAFQFWSDGKLQAKGALEKIFKKLGQLFDKIRNYIDGYGFKSIDDIFEAVDRGAYAKSDKSVLMKNSRDIYTALDKESTELLSKDTLQTNSESFKKWFGGSKVVDANGEPLVVYHGTSKDGDFKSFNTGTRGAWFSSDPKDASSYAADNDSQTAVYTGGNFVPKNTASRVMPVYLSIKNPYSLSEQETEKYKTASSYRAAQREIVAKARAGGHDGVDFGGGTWVALNKGDIKSAIGNRGTFDPENANTLYSRDASMSPAEQVRANALEKQSIQDIARRVQVGELPHTQLMSALAAAVDNADAPEQTYSRLMGATKEQMKGSLSRAYLSNFSTGNNIAKRSAGYKNVFDTISAYNQSKNKLIADNLDLGLSKWKPWEANAGDAKLAGKFLLDRTSGNWKKDSAEYQKAYGNLTAEQKAMVEQANKVIPEMLAAEFEADKVGYRAALNDEQYAKWEADRKAQIDRLVEEGYVPERRYGNFGVSVHVPVTDKFGVTKPMLMRYDLFETQAEQELWYRDMIGDDKNPGPLAGLGLVIEKGTKYKPEFDASMSFRQFLDMANANGVRLTQPEIERLAKATITADSTRRNRVFQRKNIPGYSEDATRVLSEFVTNISNKVSYAEYGDAIQKALRGDRVSIGWDSASGKPTMTIEKDAQVWRQDGANSGYFHAEAEKMVNAVVGPQETSNWSRVAKMAATMQFLGGSAALVPVQLSSIPINVVPYLFQHTSYTNALTTAFSSLSKTMANSGTLFDLGKLSDKTNKVDWVDNTPGMRDAMIRAGEDGTTMDTELYQLMGMTRGGLMAKSRTAQRAVEAWMFPFRWSEKANRVATFAAAYKVGSEKLSGDALYKFAQQAVFDTQIRYDAANRPAVMRNPIYALLLTFKTYPIAMTELLVNLYKEKPSAAVAMLGSLGLMAGVNGMPFRENIMDLVDTIAQRLFGQPFNSQRWMRNHLKNASEAMVGADYSGLFLNGLINSMTDLNMQSRVGLHNIIPGTRMAAADVDWTQEATQILGPLGSQVIGAVKGTGSLLKGDFTQALREAGPAAAQNMVKAAEQYQHGYALDGKGQKLVDVSGWNVFWQALGFSNATLSNAYEMDRIDKQTWAFYNTVRADFIKNITDGVRDNDREKVANTVELLSKWNQANPDMPISLDPGSLRRHIMQSGMPINQRTMQRLPQRLRGSSFSQQETLANQ